MNKILMSIMAIGIAVSMLGAGTFAYFSDTETSTGNTFTAGTLDMEIADSNEGWNDGTPVTASWQSPDGWVPGETFTTGTIRLKNVGSIDIEYLFTTFYNYAWTGNANLGKVIEVVGYYEFIPGKAWFNNIGGTQGLETQVGDKIAPLTLKELVDAYWAGDTTWIDYCSGNGYDAQTVVGEPAIPVGGTYETYLVLKFMETAGNNYQGASCSFDIAFEGVQDLSQGH